MVNFELAHLQFTIQHTKQVKPAQREAAAEVSKTSLQPFPVTGLSTESSDN